MGRNTRPRRVRAYVWKGGMVGGIWYVTSKPWGLMEERDHWFGSYPTWREAIDRAFDVVGVDELVMEPCS